MSRQDLLDRFNIAQTTGLSLEQFSAALEELLQVQVQMLDDGVKSDYYFIHE
jgi:hypothetical protein